MAKSDTLPLPTAAARQSQIPSSLAGDHQRLIALRDGKPIKSLRGAWESACTAAGLAGRMPHDFRRTAVRNLEQIGVSRSAAMTMVGHKTEAIYRRYAIVECRCASRRRG
jgi:integrase